MNHLLKNLTLLSCTFLLFVDLFHLHLLLVCYAEYVMLVCYAEHMLFHI